MIVTKIDFKDLKNISNYEFYSKIGYQNPITNAVLPEIYDIVHGRFFYRFFLSEFVEKKGLKKTLDYSFYYASEWNFVLSNEGIKLAKQLISLNFFKCDEHIEKALIHLFSFALHVWVHVSDLIFNKKNKVIFSGVSLMNRIAQSKHAIKHSDLILDINETIGFYSYSYLKDFIYYEINYSELKMNKHTNDKVVYKIPDLSLFSLKKHMPYENIINIYEKNNIVLYQSVCEDEVMVQGIYRLKKLKNFSLIIQKGDRISSSEANKFKSINYV